MKKTVVIIILAVYIASIAVVNFFGLEIKQYDGETYVGSIEISDVLFLGNNNTPLTPIPSYDGTLIYTFDYIPPAEGGNYSPDDPTNHNMIRLDFIMLSEEGQLMALDDDNRIEFIYAADSGVAFFHEGTNSFVFLKPNQLFTLTLKATDGHNAKTQVHIMAVDPSTAPRK